MHHPAHLHNENEIKSHNTAKFKKRRHLDHSEGTYELYLRKTTNTGEARQGTRRLVPEFNMKPTRAQARTPTSVIDKQGQKNKEITAHPSRVIGRTGMVSSSSKTLAQLCPLVA